VGGSLARAALAAAVIVAALAGAAPAAAAQTTEPQVLKREPYYLAVHEADGRSRGTVLMLHGGGWRGDLGPDADGVMREWIDRMTAWGYDVANLGYRTGAPGLADALAAFDLVRERRGARERLCIFGGSAGAQLALWVAAERGEDVDCVIDLLGPPDLVEWGSAPASDVGLRLATAAFGEERLAGLSPINMVERIDAPVLVAAAPCDVFIELAAQERFVEALDDAGGSVRLQVVDSGDEVPLGHCTVEHGSFEQFLDVARRFLAGQLPPAQAAPADDGGSGISAIAIVAAAVALAVGGYWVLSRTRSSRA
jgi:acetyl esterase/lipase